MRQDSKYAVRVQGVSKQYRIGASAAEGMLRDSITRGLKRLMGRDAKKDDAPTIWAVKDLSLDIGKEEVVGVIGRNGSGKTTLLKLLSKITYPTEGRIDVAGRVASLVEVGTGFHPELSGRENVYLNGSILGLKRKEIDARFDQIVEYSGVEAFLDTPVKRFSTGMRLRLGFAVAAHLFPDVLLVDEVLAVGDAEFQAKCLQTMGEVGRRGHAVVFVSHNLEAVENLCPRTIWLDRGVLRADGPSKDVIAEYLRETSVAPKGTIDLTEVDGREGTGEARFLGLEFLDASGTPPVATRSGDPLTIRLRYEILETVRGPYFGVTFNSEFGSIVANPNTWSSGVDLGVVEPGVYTLDLVIDRLHLMPGTYPITLWLNRHGDDISMDWLESCTVLQVAAPTAAVLPRPLKRRAGTVFLDAKWRPMG